ncbi:hypothetical protein P3T37_000338 [Kitasatospora sp. MAA4]|uniref:helicase C-terminal domain-containing protein n=1 Tax=Kitasatospora sp. MAA4 TaxID=3035093 RepID=UPI0024761BCE|nr:helicase C-terminal domain-containing protein [Kitasatospora sp. MAA4]MDH6130971.1 hypothetical protein [Kitasatospora sp. MAA4]
MPTATLLTNIGRAVHALRAGHVGLVVLVDTYDGINLPGKACEVLVMDGLPEAYGGITRREQVLLGDSDGMVNRQLQRLEQGMGRSVRSRSDHCVVLLLGPRLSQLIASPQYRERFGPATRVQIELSRKVAQPLVKALAYNPSLLRPLEGVKATRLTANNPQTIQAAKYLETTYRDRNSLLLGIDSLLADLVYDPKRVPAFEAALERLGLHLGFAAQRPEQSVRNGPDVLWAIGNLRYLVLEAKSGATTDKIWRSVVEQLPIQ